MSHKLIVPGRYANHTFIPDGKLPDTEGAAELLITPQSNGPARSIFEVFGKAATLRTKEDIAAQIQEERAEWGEP